RTGARHDRRLCRRDGCGDDQLRPRARGRRAAARRREAAVDAQGARPTRDASDHDHRAPAALLLSRVVAELRLRDELGAHARLRPRHRPRARASGRRRRALLRLGRRAAFLGGQMSRVMRTWASLALGLAMMACGSEVGPADGAAEFDAAIDGGIGAADASVVRDAGADAEVEGDSGSPDAGPPPPEVRFVWPIDAWVAANEEYYMRGEHSGSADLAAPHGTPVFAARGGRVTSARWTRLGGNTLVIDHGEGYSTVYSHLIEPAVVEAGDVVEAGQLVGALGRTGNAYLNGAHLHFAIRRDGVRLVVPGLDYGAWIQRGEAIPGDYSELDTFPAVRPSYEVEVVDD